MHARGGFSLLILSAALAGCSDRTPGLVEAREPAFQTQTSSDVGTAGLVFRSDSGSISGVGCWTDANRSGCVQVSRSRIGSTLTTFLFYTVDECAPRSAAADTIPGDSIPGDSIPPPPPCTTIEGGFGSIPTGDLAGSGISALSLRTNTSAAANPDFNRFAGAGGEIAVDWTRSGFSSFRTSGNTRSTFGDFVVQTAGSTWFSDALIAGTVVAFPVGTTTFASIFRSQQLIIGLQRGS